MDDNAFMQEALAEAYTAAREDEVPVGAVVVKNGIVIARGRNATRSMNCPTRHAEMRAIEEAASVLGNERLVDCDLYVTKEPCAMCAGAAVNARVRRVIIGAADHKAGACGSVLSVCGNRLLNHRPDIVFGVCGEEASRILVEFFRTKRG